MREGGLKDPQRRAPKKDRAPKKGDDVVVFWEKEQPPTKARVASATEQKGEL